MVMEEDNHQCQTNTRVERCIIIVSGTRKKNDTMVCNLFQSDIGLGHEHRLHRYDIDTLLAGNGGT